MACAADEESTLRCALSCLRPFLALFGLVPSRVIPFFGQDGRQDPSEQLQQFPSKYGQCIVSSVERICLHHHRRRHHHRIYLNNEVFSRDDCPYQGREKV